MIRRVTRRSRRRRPEPRKGAALERRIDLWPFLLAAGLTAAAITAVAPRPDSVPERHAAAERQPSTGAQVSQRLDAGRR